MPVRQVGADDDVVVSDAGRNPDLTVDEELVERAFSYPETISKTLKDRFDL
ncbi:MAG: hypothetical protein IMY81_03560 [Chloroflexi bacterium]|nr:hypothetical protein [Chloroflexota bacterium]